MHFPVCAASILFLSVFGHKINVLNSPALFQGKELQVTHFKTFKVMCFWMYTMKFLADIFFIKLLSKLHKIIK